MTWSLKKNSVLVPFDFSDGCRRAIRVARSFVDSDAAIIVMHVVRPPATSYPGVLWTDMDAESIRARAHQALCKELSRLEVGAEAVTSIGSPAAEIVSRAAAEKSELIVMPSHGRTGIERVLLGSVTEKVVRKAQIPVLVLRAQD